MHLTDHVPGSFGSRTKLYAAALSVNIQPTRGVPLWRVLRKPAEDLIQPNTSSIRLRLRWLPLRITNPSPPSGWVEDFQLQAIEHARHTTNPLPRSARRAQRANQAQAVGSRREVR